MSKEFCLRSAVAGGGSTPNSEVGGCLTPPQQAFRTGVVLTARQGRPLRAFRGWKIVFYVSREKQIAVLCGGGLESSAQFRFSVFPHSRRETGKENEKEKRRREKLIAHTVVTWFMML